MPAPRKRPCSICRQWFRPNERVGPRQHACSKSECQAARRKKTQANWRAKNPEYAAGYRIQQRGAREQPPEPLRLPPPLSQLPWDLAKDEFGQKGSDFIGVMGSLLVRSVAADPSLATSGVPLFQTIETYKPHPAALFQGGLLAVLSIAIAVLLIAKAGGVARPFLIGANFSRAGLLHVDRNSIAASDLGTAIKVGPDPFEAWLKLARPYFSSMPVLRALDADRDLTLSPWELDNAPAALRKLDIYNDGKLTPQECGLHIDPHSVPPALLAQLRHRFMTFHPVLAALDADHDGEISEQELARAAASLKTLDRNGDGYLTADELIPFEMAVHAGLR